MFYKYLFIFALFSILGWIMEVIYRSLITKKIVNPGFMSGCVLPLYGMGAIILNIICIIISKADISYNVLLVFLVSTIFLTFLEFICGFISLKFFHLRLWDYRICKFNYKGFVCVKFSILWGLLGTLYYLCVYPYIDTISLNFISNNIGIFSLGIFLGIFIIDLSVSINLLNRLIKYANAIKQTIDVEKLKLEARINIGTKKLLNAIYPYVSINKYLKERIEKIKNKK